MILKNIDLIPPNLSILADTTLASRDTTIVDVVGSGWGPTEITSILSVVIGLAALIFAWQRTQSLNNQIDILEKQIDIAEKSRIDPLLQVHQTLKANLIAELVQAMRECLTAAEAYRLIREKMYRRGKPDIANQVEGERGEQLLKAKRKLNELELKATTVLPEDMIEEIGAFRELFEEFRSSNGKVAEKGEDMFEELIGHYWDFLQSSRSSIASEQLEKDAKDLIDPTDKTT